MYERLPLRHTNNDQQLLWSEANDALSADTDSPAMYIYNADGTNCFEYVVT